MANTSMPASTEKAAPPPKVTQGEKRNGEDYTNSAAEWAAKRFDMKESTAATAIPILAAGGIFLGATMLSDSINSGAKKIAGGLGGFLRKIPLIGEPIASALEAVAETASLIIGGVGAFLAFSWLKTDKQFDKPEKWFKSEETSGTVDKKNYSNLRYAANAYEAELNKGRKPEQPKIEIDFTNAKARRELRDFIEDQQGKNRKVGDEMSGTARDNARSDYVRFTNAEEELRALEREISRSLTSKQIDRANALAELASLERNASPQPGLMQRIEKPQSVSK